jgi:CBS domain containing-hemolysin-like protein
VELEREIQSLVTSGKEEGLLDPQSGEMIQSILDFRETVVREIMIPRTEMVVIPSDASIADIMGLVIRHGHTRMPVYQGSVDNIVGILNVKDLLKFWSREVTEEDIVSLSRKPYYIPETKNIHQLLYELRQKKFHMAIIIDEYGGTSGLVTLEDLVEEIVGEIHDEHDAPEEDIMEMPDGYTLIDGKTEIEKVEEHFGVSFPEGDYETMGGLILLTINRIPVTGEVVHIDDFQLLIDDADERSIRKIKVKRLTGHTVSGESE